MCRSIRRLYNYAPPVTDEEIRAACLQFVRKVSGFSKPSRANEAAFMTAVAEISTSTARLMAALTSNAAPRDRSADASAVARRFVSRPTRAEQGS